MVATVVASGCELFAAMERRVSDFPPMIAVILLLCGSVRHMNVEISSLADLVLVRTNKRKQKALQFLTS